ncbi:flagellar hook-length control protein FliK [Anoxybacillus flavithermus]|uniref:Flagellar hook-length control protein FliK n=1 Tax=Anoxybacillus flavithermus TaxID=33934 RepID=A0A2G5RTL5_9BACL|nr:MULTISPECIES: flagellar hook-length control protein FliK [Anoxybacillus]KFZ43339.1 flagellar hook-length control protein FliK [Anoxybacillus sp. KU2-6(11)]PIC06001.1 flagellar hook-length control protein FliK [Anoxybacillus flavithermus]
MNIAPISSIVSFGGSHQQATVQTGDGDVFSQLLSSLRQTSESLQALSEQPETMQRVDWEQLQQWFEQLPAHDAYADKHILSTEMIQSFLSLLPEETKEQIVQRFSAEPPFETMFSASDDHDEKDELMLVIALFQLEQKQWTIPQSMTEQVRTTLRNVFGVQDEQSDTMTAMLQAMLDNQTRLDSRLNANEVKRKTVKSMAQTIADRQSQLNNVHSVNKMESESVELTARMITDHQVRWSGKEKIKDKLLNIVPSTHESLATDVEKIFEDGNINSDLFRKYPITSRAQLVSTYVQEQQSSGSAKKEDALLTQERKQWTIRLSDLVHAVQQSDDKHVPFDRPTIDTTNETPFVAQFERIVRSSQFTRWKNGNAQMLIRLQPEHLGYITIKLIQQKGKLTAKMITSTEAAKQLVEQHIHQLAHIADHITVEQFNVFDQAKFRDHSFHQQKQQQQQQEQPREEKKQPDQSFDEWLNEWFDFDM